MSSLLDRLPGDIPRLLRPCSPLARLNARATVEAVFENLITGVLSLELVGQPRRALATTWDLLLTDPTGRVHAAWWAMAEGGMELGLSDEAGLVEMALYCDEFTATEIDTLARLVLRLAGREGWRP